MRYLLDTCVLSEFLTKSPNTKVTDWVGTEPEEFQFISVMTVGETRKGLSRLPASRRKNELLEWFGSVIVRYSGRIIEFDLNSANRWGDFMASLESKGRPIPLIDSFIAATALEHNLTIVTRNDADFTDTGARVLNIWK